MALAALSRAAALCERVRAIEAPAAMTKADRSPVTVADYGAQALVCRALRAAFANDPIVAEEDAGALDGSTGRDLLARATAHLTWVLSAAEEPSPQGQSAATLAPNPNAADVRAWIDGGSTAPSDPTSDRFWTLDPIDGTKGFLRGDQYAIALALVEDGRVRLALLACPAFARERDGSGPTGVMIEATDEGGAYLHPLVTSPASASSTYANGRRLHVAAPDEATARRFVESVEGAHGDPARQAAVAGAAGIDAAPLRLDSQVKYAAVADGRAGLYLRLPNPDTPTYREKIWDHAAGALIVREAGGRVTDADGRPLDFRHGRRLERNRGIVAGAPAQQRAAVKALRTTGTQPAVLADA